MSIKDLYAHIMQEHYAHPKNKGVFEAPDLVSRQYNPTCGDIIQVQGNISKNIVTELRFEGEGCVISLATASIMTEFCSGKTIEDILAINDEKLQEVIGMQLGPSRLKCAQLSIRAIQEGLTEYREKHA